MANFTAAQYADSLAREPVPLRRPALVPPHVQDLPEIRVNNRQTGRIRENCPAPNRWCNLPHRIDRQRRVFERYLQEYFARQANRHGKQVTDAQ